MTASIHGFIKFIVKAVISYAAPESNLIVIVTI